MQSSVVGWEVGQNVLAPLNWCTGFVSPWQRISAQRAPQRRSWKSRLVIIIRGRKTSLLRRGYIASIFPRVDQFVVDSFHPSTTIQHSQSSRLPRTVFNKSAKMGAKSQIKLEKEDHQRDADFKKALHGDSHEAQGGFSAILKKDKDGQKIAVDEYFKHFDNKRAEDETDADREVSTIARR